MSNPTRMQVTTEAKRILAIGGVDADGMYGKQCMDLTVYLCTKFWGFRPIGNAIDLKTQALPDGWRRLPNTADFVPQEGDFGIWALGSFVAYGHTDYILSGNMNSFVGIDQNWVNASANGSPPAQVTHNYIGFWGVLRPPYAGQGDDDMIEDTDRHYDLIAQTFEDSTGRQERVGARLSRDEFRNNFVGKDKLEALTIIQSSPETGEWRADGVLGLQAKSANWQKQITDAKAAATTATQIAGIRYGYLTSIFNALGITRTKDEGQTNAQAVQKILDNSKALVAAKTETDAAVKQANTLQDQAVTDQQAGDSFLRRLGQFLSKYIPSSGS